LRKTRFLKKAGFPHPSGKNLVDQYGP